MRPLYVNFKIQDFLFCRLFISLTTPKRIRRNKENRVLHIVEKEGEVRSDHSSKCFRDGHYHMISGERKVFVISWHARLQREKK